MTLCAKCRGVAGEAVEQRTHLQIVGVPFSAFLLELAHHQIVELQSFSPGLTLEQVLIFGFGKSCAALPQLREILRGALALAAQEHRDDAGLRLTTAIPIVLQVSSKLAE